MGVEFLRTEGQALKSFRLTDVPEHVRIEAALACADEINRALKGRRGDRTHTLEALAAVDVASEAMRLALHPSDHVYRVSQQAWDDMVARATRR